jgi:hypothetical protein
MTQHGQDLDRLSLPMERCCYRRREHFPSRPVLRASTHRRTGIWGSGAPRAHGQSQHDITKEEEPLLATATHRRARPPTLLSQGDASMKAMTPQRRRRSAVAASINILGFHPRQVREGGWTSMSPLTPPLFHDAHSEGKEGLEESFHNNQTCWVWISAKFHNSSTK